KPPTETGSTPKSSSDRDERPRTWKELGNPLQPDGSLRYETPRPMSKAEVIEEWKKRRGATSQDG
ncbi:MAG TPA: hypothetical protein QGF58_28235, partial [Myxococcota bacterium]|nr:hypothetical protein [Myxococcota bacterium]